MDFSSTFVYFQNMRNKNGMANNEILIIVT